MQAAVSNSKITNRIKLVIFKGYLTASKLGNVRAALLHFQGNESDIDNASNKLLFRVANELKNPGSLDGSTLNDKNIKTMFAALEKFICKGITVDDSTIKTIESALPREEKTDDEEESNAPITAIDLPQLAALYEMIDKNIGFKSQAASATVVAAPGDLASEFYLACFAITEPLQQMVNNA